MNTNSTTTTTTPNFDNLLLQSLMSRLQLRQPPPPQSSPSLHHPLLSQSFEDLLDAATNNADFPFSFSDDDEDDFSDSGDDTKTLLSKEESRLEKDLIKIILSGSTDTLKPNSGQAVAIGDHHVCVGFHEENGSDYRVWEWHGHIMLFDEENGYTPEYIYGNYFERLMAKGSNNNKKVKKVEEEDEEGDQKVENLGLRELIDGVASPGTRILHQSRNAGSARCL